MKFKLDENLGDLGAKLLRQAGYDVSTVAEQKLCSASDIDLVNHCHSEGRALVTLDMDFANPLRFQPNHFSGIAVLRIPSRFSVEELLLRMETLIYALQSRELVGKLWIVQRGRIREFQG